MEEPSTTASSSSGDDSSSVSGATNKTAQCSVISIYQAKIVDAYRTVTVVWLKNLINHSLSVTVDKSLSESATFTCKVDLKPWPFWSKKGLKSFDIDNHRVDVFWDLRSAKFSSGPEPVAGYYVALVCNEEVILLVGDCKKEAYKRTKSRPSLEEATLVTKKENVFGKKSFCTRVRFDERRKKEHDILIENSILGSKEPEMWISVDGKVVIRVSNLQWKFRGNETVMVENVPVQVFWDVHDWLFGTPGMGHALFIFKPPADLNREEEEEEGGKRAAVAVEAEKKATTTQGGGGLVVPEFCFFLYAWKME